MFVAHEPSPFAARALHWPSEYRWRRRDRANVERDPAPPRTGAKIPNSAIAPLLRNAATHVLIIDY